MGPLVLDVLLRVVSCHHFRTGLEHMSRYRTPFPALRGCVRDVYLQCDPDVCMRLQVLLPVVHVA